MAVKKNIKYVPKSHTEYHPQRHSLDVFYLDTVEKCPVVIFIHGGSWSGGSKDIYDKLGYNLSELNIVTVIINYRLAPVFNYEKMAFDCASSVKWAYENIGKYNGDSSNIFLMGHSAGGHLAALMSLNKEFFAALNISNPVKGCILIDPFGLNIYDFLKYHNSWYNEMLHQVFTNDENHWKRGSPSMHVSNKVPFLVYTGASTYPFLLEDNKLFVGAMKKKGASIRHIIHPNKSHIQMISQLESKSNKMYGEIVTFIKEAGRVA